MTRNPGWDQYRNPNYDPDNPSSPPYLGVPFSELWAAAQASSERDWFAKGAIEGNPMMLWVGPEKSHKSWMAIQLACATVKAQRWLDYFQIIRPGRVLYLDGEYGEHEFARRAVRICRGMRVDPAVVLPCIFHLHSGEVTLHADDPLLQMLARRVPDIDPALIVIDPFRNHLLGSENDADAVIAAYRAVEMLRGEVRCPVLILHHMNKSSKMSGSRAMTTRADLIFEAEGEKEYHVKGRTLREKDPVRIPFSIACQHLHDDDDARAMTIVRRQVESESPLDEKILELCASEPHSKTWIAKKLGRSGADVGECIDDLEARQLLERAKLHVNGREFTGYVSTGRAPDDFCDDEIG